VRAVIIMVFSLDIRPLSGRETDLNLPQPSGASRKPPIC
jgi:hypothetical protein